MDERCDTETSGAGGQDPPPPPPLGPSPRLPTPTVDVLQNDREVTRMKTEHAATLPPMKIEAPLPKCEEPSFRTLASFFKLVERKQDKLNSKSTLKSPQIFENNQDFSNTVTPSDHDNYQQKEKVKLISKHDHQQKLYKEVNRSLEHQSLSKFTKTSKVNPRLKRTDSYS